MSGNILQGLGALGALFSVGLVLWFFKSVPSNNEVIMPSGKQHAFQPSSGTITEEKEAITEVTMTRCQHCGNLMPETLNSVLIGPEDSEIRER